MKNLNLQQLENVNGGEWTFSDFSDYTSKGAWSCGAAGLVGGAITGPGALAGGAAGFAGGFVGGAIQWAYDSANGK